MTPDNRNTTGWVIFIAAIGMMATLFSTDIRALNNWGDATQPAFIADALAHFGAVIAAFIGGKIIPEGNKNG